MSLWTDFRDSAFSKLEDKAKEKVAESFFDTTREDSKKQPTLTKSTGVEPLSPTARESYDADNTGSSREATDKTGPEGGFKISKTMLIGGAILLGAALYLRSN